MKVAFENGQLEALYQDYFADTLLLLNKQRQVFYLNNNNIDSSFFKQDKPYLLDQISKLERQNQPQLADNIDSQQSHKSK